MSLDLIFLRLIGGICFYTLCILFYEIFLGGYSKGNTPVPIPNTAVKAFSGDGTAGFACGRVARCRVFILEGSRTYVLEPFFVSIWQLLKEVRTPRGAIADDHASNVTIFRTKQFV